MKAVVDASILIRAVIPGDYTDEVRRWLATAGELLAPGLIWYEVGSVLRYLEFMKTVDAATVDRSLKQLLALPVALASGEPLYKKAIALSRELDVSRTYDMAYLALSVQTGCPLVTLDRRLVRNAAGSGYVVHHPADLPGA